MQSESERLKVEADTYIDALLARMTYPGYAEAKLIGDRRFLVSCMVGFACQRVAATLEKLAAA